MRSTSTASSCRWVITAEVCGSRSRPRKVAPPLKSTSTKLSCSGLWVAASATTRVRSSSDLPEPVAPMHSPCGPMPPSADSRRSRVTGTAGPPAPRVTPTGTVSRSAGGVRHSSGGCAPPRPSGPSKPSSAGRSLATAPRPWPGRRHDAVARARVAAARGDIASGTPRSSRPLSVWAISRSAAVSARPSSRARVRSAVGAPVPTSMTQASESSSRKSSVPVVVTPSTTSTR